MIRSILLTAAITLSSGVMAQKVEQISTAEQTQFMQMGTEQRITWMDRQLATNASERWVPIIPDSPCAGEAFDLYFAMRTDNNTESATIELYDLRAKRPKRMMRQEFIPTQLIAFPILLKVTIDEPGKYEVVAYYESQLMESPENPEQYICRRTFTIQPKKQ